jgi:plasmid segregation protein ParM
MLFSIDHGNYAIKTPNDCFIAGLAEYPVRPPLAEHVIEHEGSFWTLTGTRISYMRDKTRDGRYFMLTLFAIARELAENGDASPYMDADLAVGLPPEHYSALKDRFAAYFKRPGVKFAYNGAPFCLTVRRVFVYPQAYAAVVPQSSMLIGAALEERASSEADGLPPPGSHYEHMADAGGIDEMVKNLDLF